MLHLFNNRPLNGLIAQFSAPFCWWGENSSTIYIIPVSEVYIVVYEIVCVVGVYRAVDWAA